MPDPCGAGSCGTGGWTGPLPGDPGDVFGLGATPEFGGIEVSWNLPNINPHAVAYTTLYRGLSANYATALKLVDWGSNRYFDKTQPGVPEREYFYWVQQVSVNGTLGPLVGPASAIARPTITEMLELLTAQIDVSLLGVELKAEIDRISLIDLNLADEIQDRLDANAALQAVLTAVQTDVGEAVTLIQDETTARITDNAAVVASLNVLAAGMDGNAAAIVTEQEARVTAVSALASTVTTLSTAVDTNTAAMTTLSTTYTSDMEALVTDIEALIASAGGEESSAALLAEGLVRANADTALASSITALEAQVADDLAAAILIEQTARATAVDAVASSVTTLQATLGAGANLLHNSSFEFDTNANGLADSWVAYSAGTVAGITRTLVADTAIHGAKVQRCAWTSSSNSTSHRVGIYQVAAVPRGATKMALSAYISGTAGARGVVHLVFYDISGVAISGGNVTSSVTLTADYQRVVAASTTIPVGAVSCRCYVWMDSFAGAAAVLIDAAQMQSGVVSSYVPSPDVAALQAEMTARIDADSALSSSITTAQTTLNGNIASAQTTLQSNIDVVDGKAVAIGARWTATVDVNGFVGGFGVYNSGATVDAGFNVDTFWVGRTTTKVKPFIISGGIVYINEAAIGKLTANAIKAWGLSIYSPSGAIILDAGTTTGNFVGQVGGTLASTLVATANTAAADATAANGLLADISADGKVTPLEKRQLKTEFDGILAAKAGINAQAADFSVTTENTAYNNAYSLVSVYMNNTGSTTNAAGALTASTTGALLSSLTTTTTLSRTYTPAGGAGLTLGAGLRAVFVDFYEARQALLNKISAVASERATWATVTGTGRPEDGATVGAPAGTLVGGVSASVVATAVNAVNNASTGLDTRLRSNGADILSGVVSVNVVSGAAGFKAGSLVWDTAGARVSGYGVALTSNGIVAYNSAFQLMFALNASTGAATFGGALDAATGTFYGTLKVGTAARSGNTMTGSGAIIDEDGSFSLGNASGNITRNGGEIIINGDIVATGNIVANGVTKLLGASGTSTSISVTTTVPAGFTYEFACFGYQDAGPETLEPEIGRTLAMTDAATITLGASVTGSTGGAGAQYLYSTNSATIVSQFSRTAGSVTITLTGRSGVAKELVVLMCKR